MEMGGCMGKGMKGSEEGPRALKWNCMYEV